MQQEEIGVQTRRRSGSLTIRESYRTSLSDDTCENGSEAMPSPHSAVIPYESRLFPLSDVEYDEILKENPVQEAIPEAGKHKQMLI